MSRKKGQKNQHKFPNKKAAKNYKNVMQAVSTIKRNLKYDDNLEIEVDEEKIYQEAEALEGKNRIEQALKYVKIKSDQAVPSMQGGKFRVRRKKITYTGDEVKQIYDTYENLRKTHRKNEALKKKDPEKYDELIKNTPSAKNIKKISDIIVHDDDDIMGSFEHSAKIAQQTLKEREDIKKENSFKGFKKSLENALKGISEDLWQFIDENLTIENTEELYNYLKTTGKASVQYMYGSDDNEMSLILLDIWTILELDDKIKKINKKFNKKGQLKPGQKATALERRIRDGTFLIEKSYTNTKKRERKNIEDIAFMIQSKMESDF